VGCAQPQEADHRPKHASLSVFFPAYNDAPSLPGLIEKTFQTLRQNVADYEVIVVNDGSADETGAVLEELRKRYAPRLRVVTHPENRGYGGALRSGFEAATKDWIFYTDGDGQYDVGELPGLLSRAGSGVGLVNGFKLERHDPFHRVWIGRVYNSFARTLFGIHLRDIDCDYRLIRRNLVKHSELTSTSGTICVELIRKVELTGCGVVEVGVHHYPRLHGRSQFFRVRSLLTTLRQLIQLHFKLVIVPVLTTGRTRLTTAERL
jgi:glycosyltransferase involved in cell wall biosynthesis